jgi:hypothetical protein
VTVCGQTIYRGYDGLGLYPFAQPGTVRFPNHVGVGMYTLMRFSDDCAHGASITVSPPGAVSFQGIARASDGTIVAAAIRAEQPGLVTLTAGRSGDPSTRIYLRQTFPFPTQAACGDPGWAQSLGARFRGVAYLITGHFIAHVADDPRVVLAIVYSGDCTHGVTLRRPAGTSLRLIRALHGSNGQVVAALYRATRPGVTRLVARRPHGGRTVAKIVVSATRHRRPT